MDDECIRLTFQSLRAIDHRRICFTIKDVLQTSRICSDDSFPSVYHHLGSCTLTIEPEFIWILVQYEVHIDKFKKCKFTLLSYSAFLLRCLIVTTTNEVLFNSDQLLLTLPVKAYPFIHHEWLIDMENFSSTIIFDIENFDGQTPAELIIFQSKISRTYHRREKHLILI